MGILPRNRLTRMFDQLNRYRLAALFFAVPTFAVLVEDKAFLGGPTELVLRVSYRIGLLILLAAIALDWWDVYTGKRKVRKMIKERTNQD